MSDGADAGSIFAKFSLDTSEMAKGVSDITDGFETIKSAAEALGLAEAFEKIGEAVEKVSEAYAVNEAALRRIASVTNTIGGADKFKALAESLAAVSVNSQAALLNTAALLTQFNLSDRQVATLLPQLQNLASATGRDLPQAAQAMGRAINSGTVSARALGFALTSTEKQAFQFGDTQDRVNILMQHMAQYTGAAADEANTAAGAHKVMENALEELESTIGGIIDKPMSDFWKEVTETVNSFKDTLDNLDPSAKEAVAQFTLWAAGIAAVTIAVTALGAAFSVIIGLFSPIATGILAIGAAALTVEGAIHRARDELAKLSQGDFSSSGLTFGQALKADFQQGLADAKQLAADTISSMTGADKKNGGLDFGGESGKTPVAADFSNKSRNPQTAEELAKKAQDEWNLMAPSLASKGPAGEQEDKNAADHALSLSVAIQNQNQAVTDATIKTGILNKAQETITAQMNGPFAGVIKTVTNSISDFVHGLDQGTQALITNAASQVGNALKGANPAISAGIQGFQSGGIMGGLGAMAGSLLTQTAGFQTILAQVSSIFSNLVTAISPITQALVPLVTMISTLLNSVIAAITPIIKMVSEILGTVLGTLKPLFDALDGIFNTLGDIFGQLMQDLQPFIQIIGNLVAAVIQPLAGAFKNIGNSLKMLEPIIELIGTVLKAVGNVMMSVMNAISSVWNSIIDAIANFVSGIPFIGGDIADALKSMELPIAALADVSDPASTVNQVDTLNNQLSLLNGQIDNGVTGFNSAVQQYLAETLGLPPPGTAPPGSTMAGTGTTSGVSPVASVSQSAAGQGSNSRIGSVGAALQAATIQDIQVIMSAAQSGLINNGQIAAQIAAATANPLNYSLPGLTLAAQGQSKLANSSAATTNNITINTAATDPAAVAIAVKQTLNKLSMNNSGGPSSFGSPRNQYGS